MPRNVTYFDDTSNSLDVLSNNRPRGNTDRHFHATQETNLCRTGDSLPYRTELELRIMRVTNDEVLENLDGVAELILRAAGGFRVDA